jgi:hypothetical protein
MSETRLNRPKPYAVDLTIDYKAIGDQDWTSGIRFLPIIIWPNTIINGRTHIGTYGYCRLIHSDELLEFRINLTHYRDAYEGDGYIVFAPDQNSTSTGVWFDDVSPYCSENQPGEHHPIFINGKIMMIPSGEIIQCPTIPMSQQKNNEQKQSGAS